MPFFIVFAMRTRCCSTHRAFSGYSRSASGPPKLSICERSSRKRWIASRRLSRPAVALFASSMPFAMAPSGRFVACGRTPQRNLPPVMGRPVGSFCTWLLSE